MEDIIQHPHTEEYKPSGESMPKKSTIRTMKSDIEELFKTTKPSLIQMMARAPIDAIPHTQGAKKSTVKKIVIYLFLICIASIGGIFFYIFYNQSLTPPPPPPVIAPPPPLSFFSVEQTRIIHGSFENRILLIQKIQDAVRETGREGTITHIAVKIAEDDHERFFTMEDLVNLYHMRAPSEFITSLEGPLMLFTYYTNQGTRFGFAVRSRDPDRTLHGFLSWENDLFSDVTPLFFDEKPDIIVMPFQDQVFRNIDWRFLELSKGKDLGIAYSLFPAKRVVIFATGREAIETVISRLYDTL